MAPFLPSIGPGRPVWKFPERLRKPALLGLGLGLGLGDKLPLHCGDRLRNTHPQRFQAQGMARKAMAEIE